jgi:SNF2 family DNA or RNA helicase
MRQKSELRPYQERIATALYDHDEHLCVLRPGGGKTVAALTAIEELIRDGVIRHALVIAPKRVARVVWPDEIEEWAHITKLRYVILDGTPDQREAQLQNAGPAQRDITIVGIDILPWLLEQIWQWPADDPIFDLLVIDEISRLRNPKGMRVKELVKMAGCWRMVWGLTGTLRPNSAQDLFMPARVVTRGKLWGNSFYQWKKKNFYQLDYNGYDWAALPGAEDRLNAEIAPHIATVAEGELIQPEPTVVLDYVELPNDAWGKYKSMHRKLLTQTGGKDVVAGSTAIAVGKLAQIANGFIYDKNGIVEDIHTAKREWLADLVENATSPTLLIYEFIEDLRVLRDELGDKLPYLGAGVSDTQAAKNIADWNAGRLPFMALHPASGGHGLNLQHGGADMAWLSPTWSAEYWEQSIARLNRSGQTRQVIVRVCVAQNTVDQMKLDRVYYKMTMQAAFETYLRSVQS